MVAALDLGSSVERRASSSLALGICYLGLLDSTKKQSVIKKRGCPSFVYSRRAI